MKIGERIFYSGEIVGIFNIQIISLSRESKKQTRGIFKCHCGEIFNSSFYSVFNSKQKSCGCARKGQKVLLRREHELKSEYCSWLDMKGRCYRPKTQRYKNYGGRGISVCDRWINSFDNFLLDLGMKPSKDYSLERINVNGNYEPSNCKWATSEEQHNNKTTSVFIEYDGKKLTAAQWGRIYGLTGTNILSRFRMGWDLDRVMNTPVVDKSGSLKWIPESQVKAIRLICDKTEIPIKNEIHTKTVNSILKKGFIELSENGFLNVSFSGKQLLKALNGKDGYRSNTKDIEIKNP